MSEKAHSVESVACAVSKLSVEQIDARLEEIEREKRSLKVLRSAAKASAGKRKRKPKAEKVSAPAAE